MRVNVILIVVVLALGLVDAARRRDRTPLASLVDRQFAFAGQPEGQCQRFHQSCNFRILQERTLQVPITIIKTITKN